MPARNVTPRPIRAKLIFNMLSGQLQQSAQQLADIIMELQTQDITPEVYMIRQDSDVIAAVRAAIKSGITLIIVAGGDGTIESVAGSLVGTPATLGIIPTGTRNNVAFNLGIPFDIPGAVALLRGGIPMKIDVGQVRHGRVNHTFIEGASLGLLSALYPYADNVQHGDLSQLPTLLSTFVGSLPSHLSLTLDGRKLPQTPALVALITNMSFIGPHFQVSPRVSCIDDRLDVFLFADTSKLDLMIRFANRAADSTLKDPNITHYRAKEIVVSAEPPMPILADSVTVGEGRATITVKPRALSVMTGPAMVGKRAGSRAGKAGVPARG